MERTWVRVRNVRLFWSSSSFSSTFGLESQVRDVRSSMLKFANFLNFYLALFRDNLGQISCEIILKYFFPHFGLQKSWLLLENETKIKAAFSLNWKLKNRSLKTFLWNASKSWYIHLYRSSKFDLWSSSSTCIFWNKIEMFEVRTCQSSSVRSSEFLSSFQH